MRYHREKPQNIIPAAGATLIWHPNELESYYDRPQNSCCLFRKRVTLSDEIKEGHLSIFADTHYILYINGKEIGRGPCRSDPRWQYLDEYEIGTYLTKGENIIAVACMFYGYDTGKSISRVPCLFASGEVLLASDERYIIQSDRTFLVYLSQAFDRTAPRINGCKGVIEVFDNTRSVAFTSLDFDDTAWVNAKERDVKHSPFWNLKRRTIPNIEFQFVSDSTVYRGGVGVAVNQQKLHTKIREEILRNTWKRNGIMARSEAIPPVPDGEFSYAFVDFGKVRVGYLTLELTAERDGDIVDVVYAEELLENRPIFNGISYRPISRFILKKGKNNLQTHFNYEAFRHVLLIFRNHEGTCTIDRAGILERRLSVGERSTFRSSDPSIQKIWDISVYSLLLCMQDAFLDSPSREQQQWMGDGRFQAIYNYYITGDCRMHEKLLLQIAQSQDYEGMTTSRYPDGNHNFPPIPSFCLQWICSFGDYYEFTGKTDLIKQLWNNILLAARWFTAFENEQGILENVPYWSYLDIEKNEQGKESDIFRGGALAHLNLMYLESLQTIAALASTVGMQPDAEHFNKKALNLAKAFRSAFWNEEKGAYADCIVNGGLSQSVSEGVNSLALLFAHQKDDARCDEIQKNIFDPTTCRENVCKVSPYFMLPFYRAMQKIGRMDIAWQETLKRYLPMIQADASTTWESWTLYETQEQGDVFQYSACHGWGAGPIVLIAEGLCGISIRGDKTSVSPSAELLSDFSGHFVTSKGTFDVCASERG